MVAEGLLYVTVAGEKDHDSYFWIKLYLDYKKIKKHLYLEGIYHSFY